MKTGLTHRRFKEYFFIFGLVAFAAAIILLRPLVSPGASPAAKNVVSQTYVQKHFSSYSQAELYTNLTAKDNVRTVEKKVYGAIVSHHFFAEKEISQMLLALRNQEYKNIVIVGPNHFNAGSGPALVSYWPYQTPWGLLEPNLTILKKIQTDGLAQNQEQPFETEHSISVLTGFIKNVFPNSQIVPIILKRNLKTQSMEKIGEWLYNNLPPESLVLASVDFSHHQDLKATLKHDLNSEQILKNLDLKNLQNIEADSPQSLAVLFAFLRLHGASKIEFINTNSAYMSGNLDSRDITSYFFATFTK